MLVPMTPLRLEPTTTGNEAGETIVFIQGWPDDASLWDDAVAALAATYRCVRITMPNFDGRRSARWGYTTDEIVDALVEVVRDAAKNGPVTLVLHDWGAYWGHPVHHRVPELVSRVVGIDVAPHFKPDPRRRAWDQRPTNRGCTGPSSSAVRSATG